MQNKGLVKTLAILLALICVFYLSFSFVVAHYDKQAKEYAAGDAAKEYFYVDSIATKKIPQTGATPVFMIVLGSVVLLLLNIEVIGDEIKSANKGGIDKTEIVKNVFDFEYCSSNNNWYVAIQLAPTPTPID